MVLHLLCCLCLTETIICKFHACSSGKNSKMFDLQVTDFHTLKETYYMKCIKIHPTLHISQYYSVRLTIRRKVAVNVGVMFRNCLLTMEALDSCCCRRHSGTPLKLCGWYDWHMRRCWARTARSWTIPMPSGWCCGHCNILQNTGNKFISISLWKQKKPTSYTRCTK